MNCDHGKTQIIKFENQKTLKYYKWECLVCGATQEETRFPGLDPLVQDWVKKSKK